MSDYPVTVNLVTRAGASRDLSLTWTEGGEPVDLTGWSARLQVRSTASSPTALVTLTSPSQIVLGGDEGTIWAGFTSAQTAGIAPGSYRYDLRLTDGTDVVYLVEGSFKVKEPVTKP